ncbi:hypothetical protein [Flavobacterium sp. XS2P14]
MICLGLIFITNITSVHLR